MKKEVQISVCIPARNRPEGLRRVVDSVLKQNYLHYEIIILDNSDDNAVEALYRDQYMKEDKIAYYRNSEVLNMGANWNACIAKARYDWIKMMHDDDWFRDENTLQEMAKELANTEGKAHAFAYYNVNEKGDEQVVRQSVMLFRLRQFFPFYLYKRNYIGNPCCTVIHRSCTSVYDPRLKWLVDIDYYMKLYFEGVRFAYHPKAIINIGISSNQATVLYKNNPDVELQEHALVAENFSEYGYFKSYFVFDTIWRLVRNMGLRVGREGGGGFTSILNYCVKIQKNIPPSILLNPYISVTLKLKYYLIYRFK